MDDPMVTNRLDPALLRVVEKRGSDRETPPRRRRPDKPENTGEDKEEAPDPDAPKHELDDLA